MNSYDNFDNISSGNGLMLSCENPFPEPVMPQFPHAYMHHQALMCYHKASEPQVPCLPT